MISYSYFILGFPFLLRSKECTYYNQTLHSVITINTRNSLQCLALVHPSHLWGWGLSMWHGFVTGSGLYLHGQIPLKPEHIRGSGRLVCLGWPCSKTLCEICSPGLWPSCMYIFQSRASVQIYIKQLYIRGKMKGCQSKQSHVCVL